MANPSGAPVLRGLTGKETELLNLTAQVWNLFSRLAQVHPSDSMEVQFYLHGIQNIVLGRPAQEQILLAATKESERGDGLLQ